MNKIKIFIGLLAILLLSSFAVGTDFTTNNGAFWTMQTSLVVGVVDLAEVNDLVETDLVFDGTDNAFNYDNSATTKATAPLTTGDAVTYSVWLKPTTLTGGGNDAIFTRLTGGTGGLSYVRVLDNGALNWYIDDGSAYISQTTSNSYITTGTFQHFVFTYENDVTTVYRDGTNKETATNNIGDTSSTIPLLVGYWNGATPRTYHGDMSGIAIFDYALSDAQVLELYTEGRDFVPQNYLETPKMTVSSETYGDYQLLNFNATINGTDYQTTNGTINTAINTTDTIEIEIQTEYFNKTYLTWETPASLVFNYSVLEVDAKNIRSNSSIDSFDLTLNSLNRTIASNASKVALYLDETTNSPLNVSVSAPTIATTDALLTFSGLNVSTSTVYVYEANSIDINIYDVSTGELMNISVNVQFNLDGNLTSNDTTDGNLFVYNLTAGNYSLTFTATDYTTVSYDALVTNFSTQTLNAYMTPTATGQSTIFAFKNVENEAIVEGVSLSVERIIDDVWTLVNVLSSDVSGRVKFDYETGVKYRFTASLSGWETREFTLNPVIFTSYNIWLTQLIEETQEQDLSGVNILAYPGTYYNNQNNTVELIFTSPDGRFEEYGFNATYKDVSIAGSGSNLYGGSLKELLLIENATLGDQVNLYYYYRLSDGSLKEFNSPYLIADTATPATHWNNKDNHYGMGLAERILIVILLVILVAGSAYMFGGAIAGGIIAMLIFGYFLFIGFVSGWLVIPSMIFIFIFTAWGATK